MGWKEVESLASGKIIVKTDGNLVSFTISGTFACSTSATLTTLATCSSQYQPLLYTETNYAVATNQWHSVYVTTTGEIKLYNNKQTNLNCDVCLISVLANPLQ